MEDDDQIVQISGTTDKLYVSEIGVSVIRELSYDEWQRAFNTFVRVETCSQFAIGDLLVYGEDNFPDKYAQAIDSTGLTYGALTNFAWVSRSVPPQNRVAGVSWTHHRMVAKKDVNEQRALLEDALNNSLTSEQFAAVLNPDKPERRASVPLPTGMSREEAKEILARSASAVSSNEGHLCDRCPYKKEN